MSTSAPSMSRRSFMGTAAAGISAGAAAALASRQAFASNTSDAPNAGGATTSGSGDKDSAAASAAAATDAMGKPTGQLPAWLEPEPEVDTPVKELSTTVLIVGAGNGGLAAAVTAAEEGLDFLLCERNPVVCDTRHWVGGFNTKFNEAAGVMNDRARTAYELARYASFKCNQRVHKVWLDESAEMVEWLDGIMSQAGYECTLDTAMGEDLETTSPTGTYVPAIQHMWHLADGSDGLDTRNKVLQERLEKAGHEILFDHELIKLVKEDKRVTGAYFDTADGVVKINAEEVILATGGYPANADMMLARAPLAVSCCTAVSYNPADAGTGIKAGLWAGARMDTEAAPMVFNRGLVAPGVDAGYDENKHFRGTVMQMNLGSQPFMKVARDGRRFYNEYAPYDFNCFAASYQPGGVWCQVFDANAAADIQRFATVGCSKRVCQQIEAGKSIEDILAPQIEAGLFFKADTLEELADKLGFTLADKAAFLYEVERYNSFYDAQEDGDFQKDPVRLSAIRTAPFYGGWYGGSLLTTTDGLTINERMQVLDTNNEVIPGLYAVGDCSGSFFANNYPEYLIGVACGRTLTEGRHVAKLLAGQKLSCCS